MKADEINIENLFTNNVQYEIPRYQRPYSWEVEHAEQLIQDIYDNYKKDEPEYFMGSIVCVEKESDIFEIVDGQQRITTLTLIISQLSNLTKNKKLSDRIMPTGDFEDSEGDPRLLVRSEETILYEEVILKNNKSFIPTNPTKTQSLFIENHKAVGLFLSDKNKENLIGLAKFLLKKVFLVRITTDTFESSYRLFNVLNNRGLPLNDSDLLKNFLFESSKNEKEKEKVDNIWKEIETLIGVEKINPFLSIYKLSQKTNSHREIKKDLNSFSSDLKNNHKNNVIELINSIKQSAESYGAIVENSFNDKVVEKCIYSLNNFSKAEWCFPIIAYQNRIKKKHDLTWRDFREFIVLLEKVYMHGQFIGLNKAKREYVCYAAVKNINRGGNKEEIKITITESANNTDFYKSLDNDLYKNNSSLRKKLTRATLLRIDQELSDDSVSKKYNGSVTIEHILPQKLKGKYWESRYTSEEHKKWINKIGNLTLLSSSMNSSAKNYSFDKKKNVYMKKNKKTSFDITADISKKDNWDKETLEENHEVMKDFVFDIWKV